MGCLFQAFISLYLVLTKTQASGHSRWADYLEQEDIPLIQVHCGQKFTLNSHKLRLKNPPQIWTKPSGGRLHKGHGKGKLMFLVLSPLSLASSFFHGIGTHFFRILTCTEYQLRYPATWTEQLLNSWPFDKEKPLLDQQDHNLQNSIINPLHIQRVIHPSSSVPLENPG